MALAKSQQSLKSWGKQKWRTKSGKKSSITGERYLPSAAIKSLSAAEYAATTAAKAAMEIPAFFSLAAFEANEANDDISVISTTIIRMINAKFIMGETEEKFPAKPAISIASSPLRNMTTCKIKPITPSANTIYLVIF